MKLAVRFGEESEISQLNTCNFRLLLNITIDCVYFTTPRRPKPKSSKSKQIFDSSPPIRTSIMQSKSS